MATVVKDFKIKSGLIVEGTTGKINNFDILTKSTADQNYIIGLIGGSATSDATPDTVVLRDANGSFSANVVTADLVGDVTGNADTATALETARTIALTGDVTGSISFDGTANVQIATTLDASFATDAEVSAAQAAAEVYADDAVDTHNNLSSGVHGVTGDVVGTTDLQTLTNKTFGSGTSASASIDMNGNKIEDLGTPTVGTDATTKDYVDSGDTATLGFANSYTDTRETAITGAYQAYADQAEVDAKAYTDTRETAITGAYQAYADQAETDAIATAAAYTDQAELDAIATAASDAAALYAPLAGATFTGEVLLSGDPTQALGAATKQYVDAVAEGLHVHASAVAATTANVDLATGGLLTVDGVTLVAGDRVLVKSQTDATENGIYVAASGAWSRAADYNSSAEVQGGDFTFVTGGTLYNSTGWVQVNTVTTLGTDPIEFDQFSGAGEYTAGTGLVLDGTSFSIDETYTATKSYVDGEITDLDASLKLYADAAEADAKSYTDAREVAITTAYETYADLAEADAKSYADGVALTAENNAKAYTDARETAITTAYQNYADSAEADARLYTDEEIAALNTDDIEEGATNLYFTDERAVDAAAGAIVAGDNITVSYDDNAGTITITGENGVANSNTDDLSEGVSNLYFTDERAQDAIATAIANGTQTNITVSYDDVNNTFSFAAENGIADSTTDDLVEGSENLYFTDERAIDAVSNVDIYPNAVIIDNVAKQVASQLVAATAGVQVGHAWAKAEYRSAEFLVKVAYGSHTEISKVLVTLDTSDNIAITEYGIVGTNGSASSISAGISGTDVQLLVTTTNNDSTVTVVGTLLV